MEGLTREELDCLYNKTENNDVNRKTKSYVRFTTIELMVLVGLFMFLWDRVLK